MGMNPGLNPLGELPPIPPPNMVLNGPVDLIVPKPAPGQPQGPIYIRPAGQQQTSFPAISQPWTSINSQTGGLAGGPTLAGGQFPQTSNPTAALPQIPPTPEIPPPHMIAPWVFYQAPKTASSVPLSGNPNSFQNNQSNYYNNYPGYQGAYPSPGTPQPQPTQAQQPQQTMPTQQGANQTEQNNQNEAKPPEEQPEQEKPEDIVAGGVTGFDNDTIKTLNERMSNADSEAVRSDAAIDFYKILEANPGLEKHPEYGPYVQAFLEKILKDPSPVVRNAGLMALEMDTVKNPSPAVRGLVQKLSMGNGMFGIESQTAKSILGRLSSTEPGAAGSPANNAQKGTDNGGTTDTAASQQSDAPKQGQRAQGLTDKDNIANTTTTQAAPKPGSFSAAGGSNLQASAEQLPRNGDKNPAGTEDIAGAENLTGLEGLDMNALQQMLSGRQPSSAQALPTASQSPSSAPPSVQPQSLNNLSSHFPEGDAPSTANLVGQRLNQVSPAMPLTTYFPPSGIPAGNQPAVSWPGQAVGDFTSRAPGVGQRLNQISAPPTEMPKNMQGMTNPRGVSV